MRNFWEQQSFLMDFKFYLQKHSKLANKIASFGKFVSSPFRRFLVGFQSVFGRVLVVRLVKGFTSQCRALNQI